VEEEVTVDEDEEVTVEEEIMLEAGEKDALSSSSSDKKSKTKQNETQIPPSPSVSVPSELSSSSSDSTNTSALFAENDEVRAKGKKTTRHSRSGGRADVLPNTSGNRQHSSTTTSGSSISRDSSSDMTTEDSGSTQVIYIRDSRDLDEVVQKCFDGNVRIEDGGVVENTWNDGEEGELCVPTKGVLIILGLLILLVTLGIGLGIFAWARNRD
jgi:hypothetical protein